jgi:hypothetical protein
MEADILFGGIKKRGHLRLGKPYRFIPEPHFEPGFAVFGLVKD